MKVQVVAPVSHQSISHFHRMFSASFHACFSFQAVFSNIVSSKRKSDSSDGPVKKKKKLKPVRDEKH